ncbi:hypothetical protein [Streptomonospora litoralis]|uniref:Uncharacterized protein n=1 Tax=Streptomonospora litoralis TaxID=2498135 RepID=A0A4P6QB13_9ACTN|nr:hypothetical protein [Streptomonospora litoralis]QBI56839.1 hypothetical protein EKD16_25495 [Streptomonospora litoralis]
MRSHLRLRQAATLLREHQLRPAPAELADLLDRIQATGCAPSVYDAAHRLVTAMTTVPADEELDPRLTEIGHEETDA